MLNCKAFGGIRLAMSQHEKKELRVCNNLPKDFLQSCCRFNVLLSSGLVGLAMGDKSLDKVVDTRLEEPANQRDEDEEAEDEHHQVDCGRGHLEGR